MKNNHLRLFIILAITIIVTAISNEQSSALSPTPAPAAKALPGSFSPGDVWFVPDTLIVPAGELFGLEVHAHTGTQSLSAWGLDISYHAGTFDYIGYSTGQQAISYVNEWPDTGQVSIGSSFMRTVDPTPDVHLVTLTFRATGGYTTTINLGVNNLIDSSVTIIGTPAGYPADITITGDIPPEPTVLATPVPTTTPMPLNITPLPTVEGNLTWTRTILVFDSVNEGHPAIEYALVEVSTLTRNAAYTDSNGECILSVLAHDTLTVSITVTAPDYLLFEYDIPALEYQNPLQIGLIPEGTTNMTPTPPGPINTNPPTAVPTPEPTETPRPLPGAGDVNSDGTIDIIDALITAQYYVGLPVAIDTAAADANCDGSINIIDALLIAQYYVGLITGLC